MRRIRTVTRDFSTETLGHCQCHEHLFIAKGKSYEVNPALWMNDKDASLTMNLIFIKTQADARWSMYSQLVQELCQ